MLKRFNLPNSSMNAWPNKYQLISPIAEYTGTEIAKLCRYGFNLRLNRFNLISSLPPWYDSNLFSFNLFFPSFILN